MGELKSRILRKNLTDAERLLWKHLRYHQLSGWKFRRQQLIGSYIVDFSCDEGRLIIELDGGQHISQMEYDRERSAWLESQGFRILRFWNHQVFQELEAIKQVIWTTLNSPALSPHLHPPARRGEEFGLSKG